jgi:ABC-type uncharacterized transport system substrate-binding protein
MRDLGYVEGRDLVTEIRFADGDPSRLSTLVAELLRLKVDLIVSNSTEVIQIVRETSKSMPLVMSTISDPLGSGLIASLAQPGGNITGLSLYSTELSGKRLELMKEAFPQVKHVDLMVLRDHPPTRLLISEMKSAARALNLTMKAFEIASSNDYEKIFSTIDRVRSSALFVQNNTVFHRTFSTITRLATKHRLLTVGSSIGFVTAGGLMAYGPNQGAMWRRSALFVDKILKGAKPADLPVEQPTKFEMAINLKTAKQIGLTIPPNVLARADRVIR